MNFKERLRTLHIEHRWLLYSLVVAILLRMVFILVINPNPQVVGGDATYYLNYGLQLTQNAAPSVPSGPVYLLYTGLIQILIPVNQQTIILLIRLLNILWHVLIILSVYVISNRYFDKPVANLASFIIAINPIFIIEAGLVETESVYLGLLFGALALYATWQSTPTIPRMILLGILLGVATETRAILLLFPVVLVFHLIRLHGWRTGLRSGAALLIFYLVIVSTWTIYSWVRWNHFVIGADGIVDYAWMGIHGQQSPQAVNAAAGNPANSDQFNQNLAVQVRDTLLTSLPTYIKTRLSNLFGAYLQPTNTNYFPGQSLKQLAGTWLRSDRSLPGLLDLTQADAFWPKLALYLFHFWTLIFGVFGMVMTWRKFWFALPLFGYVLYTTVVHSILLALPRYLLPVEPILIIFASFATISAVQVLTSRYEVHTPQIAHE